MMRAALFDTRRGGDYVPPPKDTRRTKVVITRDLLIEGERQAKGSVLSLPRWQADELVASGPTLTLPSNTPVVKPHGSRHPKGWLKRVCI